MSTPPEPGGGLLGPLDAAFAALGDDDVDAATESDAPVGTTASRHPISAHEESTTAVTAVTTAAAAAVVTTGPHRVVDARAQAIADRLLGRPSQLVVWRLVDATDRVTVVRRPLVVGRDDHRPDDRPHDDHRPDDHLHDDQPHDETDTGTLVVAYAVVSRRHCRIELDGDRAVVRDLGSSNGTVVLRDDLVISVGADAVDLRDGDVLATAGGRLRLVRVERTGAPA